jgi:hypothetical protein
MRIILATCLALLAAPLAAESAKQEDCRYQAQVARAVQQARMQGVSERNLPDAIARTNPGWPERYNNAIPIFAAEMYRRKKNELRDVDIGAQWLEMCLSQ